MIDTWKEVKDRMGSENLEQFGNCILQLRQLLYGAAKDPECLDYFAFGLHELFDLALQLYTFNHSNRAKT